MDDYIKKEINEEAMIFCCEKCAEEYLGIL